MDTKMNTVVSKACAFFEDAAIAPNPIPAFVGGMRAICDGVELGPLPTPERGALALLLTATRPNMLRFARERAVDVERLENLWPVIEPVMHTLAVLPAFSLTADERAVRGLTTHEELCAQLRHSADLLESLAAPAPFASTDPVTARSRH